MEMKREYILKVIVGIIICAFCMMGFETKSIGYFTTYTTSKGNMALPNYILKTKMIKEDYDKGKNVIVQNTGTAPCFVRVKVLVPSKISYTIKSDTGKWIEHADGYLYYNEALVDNTKQTEKLIIEIEGSSAKYFNCIVIGESSLAMYNEAGTAYADWYREGDAS